MCVFCSSLNRPGSRIQSITILRLIQYIYHWNQGNKTTRFQWFLFLSNHKYGLKLSLWDIYRFYICVFCCCQYTPSNCQPREVLFGHLKKKWSDPFLPQNTIPGTVIYKYADYFFNLNKGKLIYNCLLYWLSIIRLYFHVWSWLIFLNTGILSGINTDISKT